MSGCRPSCRQFRQRLGHPQTVGSHPAHPGEPQSLSGGPGAQTNFPGPDTVVHQSHIPCPYVRRSPAPPARQNRSGVRAPPPRHPPAASFPLRYRRPRRRHPVYRFPAMRSAGPLPRRTANQMSVQTHRPNRFGGWVQPPRQESLLPRGWQPALPRGRVPARTFPLPEKHRPGPAVGCPASRARSPWASNQRKTHSHRQTPVRFRQKTETHLRVPAPMERIRLAHPLLLNSSSSKRSFRPNKIQAARLFQLSAKVRGIPVRFRSVIRHTVIHLYIR